LPFEASLREGKLEKDTVKNDEHDCQDEKDELGHSEREFLFFSIVEVAIINNIHRGVVDPITFAEKGRPRKAVLLVFVRDYNRLPRGKELVTNVARKTAMARALAMLEKALCARCLEIAA
jgi:hypothetical protein